MFEGGASKAGARPFLIMVTRGLLTAAAITVSVLLWTAGPAMALPVPVINAPATAIQGQPVTFASASLPTPPDGVISSTAWDFGDGGTGTGVSVPHTFNTPGTFTVTLTVTDQFGVASVPQPVTVQPPPAPVAAFTLAPAVVLPGQPVTFTSQSTTVPGGTLTTTWNFGDGTTGSGATVQHPYAQPGTYTVNMHVADSRGPAADAPPQMVRVNAPPTAAFEVFPPSPLVGEQVTLVSYSSDPEGGLSRHDWEFDGDGDFNDASGARVTVAFTTPGKRVVMLRVTDGDGATGTKSVTVEAKASSWLEPIGGGPSGSNGGPPPAVTNKKAFELLTPVPVVRIGAWLLQKGARIVKLAVRAPLGSRVQVRCRGKRCRARPLTKTVASKKGRVVRFKKPWGFLPAGTVVEVFVRRGDQLGKYTRFKIRAERREPRRLDGCLPPKTTKAVTCPED
jgi:PKD repeat protein